MNKNTNNRILILTGVFPPDIGGPATQLDALSNELIKNSYQVRILAYGPDDNIERAYPVKRVAKNLPFRLRNFIFLVYGLIYGLNCDIVYSQDLYMAGLTGLIIKKLLRKKLITRFVGDSAWEVASFRRWIDDDIMTFQDKTYSKEIEWRKKIRKKILVDSDQVIVVSQFLKELAQKIGVPSNKIKVIYNSVDFIKIPPALSNKEALKRKLGFDGIVLLTIARLTPWKGVDMLIEIMPDLIKKYNKINLVVAGEGTEMEKLKELTDQHGLKKNVYFQGKLGRQGILEHLRAADLFVLNTNYEGMSHTVLEAMKMGLPIITTKAGGNPETIKDKETGLLVDYKNKEQWIRAISMLLDDPSVAQKLSSQAKQDLNRFNWQNLVQETITIFSRTVL